MLILEIILCILVIIIMSLCVFKKEQSITDMLIWMVIIFIYFIHSVLMDYNYKSGQIDALTGKVKYELIVNSDSTKTWEKIPGIDN